METKATRPNHPRQILWMLLLQVLLSGCSTIDLPKYEAQPFDQYACSQIKDGLAIAVLPFANKEDTERYFGTDLLSANILAVFVLAENRDSTSSYILLKDRPLLVSEQTDIHKGSLGTQPKSDVPGHALELGSAIAAIATPYAEPLALPLILFGQKMVADSYEINYNLAVKELHLLTLSPGRQRSGVVYFKLPEEKTTSGQWVIHLEALDLKSKKSISFDIPFKWDEK